MSKNYGDNAPLSYNKYLRVQDLINLQGCLSNLYITMNCCLSRCIRLMSLVQTNPA